MNTHIQDSEREPIMRNLFHFDHNIEIKGIWMFHKI